ncbi:hypothetical protein CMI47_14095 [Candidatus Pacearchaeota archaeon]|jgi:hypothetical protein|nr:hypothetical protein [Candidatus Pacearchaeota archaeon]|tara:strand:+ start:11059 stop:11286 length:228 start_codon:yes stop_codon:yes gene_type:complete
MSKIDRRRVVNKKDSINVRSDIKFADAINNIIIKRQPLFPKEKRKPKAAKRITEAITKHNLFPKIKQDIIEANLL